MQADALQTLRGRPARMNRVTPPALTYRRRGALIEHTAAASTVSTVRVTSPAPAESTRAASRCVAAPCGPSCTR